MQKIDGLVFQYLQKEVGIAPDDLKKIGRMIFRRCGSQWTAYNLACVLFAWERRCELKDWITYAAASLNNKVPALEKFAQVEVRAKGIIEGLKLKV